MSNYIVYNGELYHHGVKGMKWGRRRYQNKDGSLTEKGIKRYAVRGYAEDIHKNRSVIGKIYDNYTGANRTEGKMQYASSSAKQNKARAEQYFKKEQRIKETRKELKKDLGFVDNIRIGSKGRDRAARYVVENGMTKVQAVGRVRKEQTVAAVAGALIDVGGVKISELKNKR